MIRQMGCILVVTTILSAGQLTMAQTQTQDKESKTNSVKSAKLGTTRNVHSCGKLFLAGQFQAEDFDVFSKKSIERIITLRTDGEIKWDEKSKAEKAGFKFVEVPFRAPDSLDDKVFDKIRKLLKEDSKSTLLHCGSANRVGAVWLPYRVLDENVDLETALKEAKEIGLRNKDYESKALDYIKRHKEKKK